MRTLLIAMGSVIALTGCSKSETEDAKDDDPLNGLEVTAAQCCDDKDNDKDGRVDCKDADCQGFVFCLGENDTDTVTDSESVSDEEMTTDSVQDDDTDSDSAAESEPDTCNNLQDCDDGEYCDLTLDTPVCRPPPSGQGEVCDSSEDCSEYEADYCETFVSMTCLKSECDPMLNDCSPGYLCCDFQFIGIPALCVDETLTGGVCGTGVTCDSDAECDSGTYCDLTQDPPSCLMPPSGQGHACTSDADCSGFQADYCETIVTSECLVQGCDKEANNCSSGYQCCDFTWMGLPSLCVDEETSGGRCACESDGDCRADESCVEIDDLPVCVPNTDAS